jgi:hypothetical protein
VAGPAAFMSYVRFDDAHEDGQLSEFRERLAGEIRIQTGREFPIFQDRNDIAWGQNWRQRIEETLDDLRKADDLASLLWERQYADWRELRFEPLTSPVIRKTIAALATRMRDTFWQSPAGPVAPASGSARSAASSAARGDATAAAGAPRHDGARTLPPTHVVDAYLRGDFATVSEAIEVAKPGDRILVRPGLYEESLVVNKPLEIIGDGPVEDIVIRARDANVLTFQASIGRVANLTLRQVGEEVMGVSIQQGVTASTA